MSGNFRQLKELEPGVKLNYATTYGISEEKVEEIFTWMQDPARKDLDEHQLSEKAIDKFDSDDEIEDELFEELAARLRTE